MFKKPSAVTLVELLISVAVVSIMILSFYSMNQFSNTHVINSDRRVKLQNELTLVLEHMGKYVQQATGDNLNSLDNRHHPAIVSIPNGFRVYVDLNDPVTPFSPNDDAAISYTLNGGNSLRVRCQGNCGVLNNNEIILSDRLTTFNFTISDNGTAIYINLVGRYNTASAASLRNPQIEIRTKLACSSCSIN